MDQSTTDAFAALALGFAFAGLLASGFELVIRRPLAFGILRLGGVVAAASVPVLVFSAPMIIMRNLLRGRRGQRTVPAVMLGAMIACGWSLLSGRLVLDVANLFAGA